MEFRQGFELLGGVGLNGDVANLAAGARRLFIVVKMDLLGWRGFLWNLADAVDHGAETFVFRASQR